MLQIVSGKFFSAEKCYETLHRGAFYTNYRASQGDAIITPVGRLLPSTDLGDLGTIRYELLEKIEWIKPAPGVMTSTGGHDLVDDFAVVFSFVLQVICTTDADLIRRLTPGVAEFDRRNDPGRYLRRVFNSQVMAQSEDRTLINDFFNALIGLKRDAYEGAIRAIRRYVTATHRIGDDTHLAYSLFVMSIEALAQTHDTPPATWLDYDEKKRCRIDKALKDAPADLGERVRLAILENEHVAMSRRFREFAIGYVSPAFFRTEAATAIRPISRADLGILLRQAYGIRSGYVHRLEGLPKLLSIPFNHAETFEIDGQPTLTFEGLARLARHAIIQFVQRSPKFEREDFNWHSALPNILRMPLAPQLWIGRPEGYTAQTAATWLQNFLTQVSAVLLRTPGAALTDLTAILDKIEKYQLDGVKTRERRSTLTLYHMFVMLAGPKYQRERHEELLKRYKADFDAPNVELLAISLVGEAQFSWNLDQLERLHDTYYRERRHKNALRLGELLEAMFTLRLAEINRAAGNEARARELVSFAVEAFPGNAAILALEGS